MAKVKEEAVQAEDTVKTDTVADQTTQPVVGEAVQAEATTTTKKSIVPSKYSGKYRGGGIGPTAAFINEQCKTSDGTFSFQVFFDLATKNGIDAAQVEKYRAQVFDEKRHGAPGRARMTIGNMLNAKARKDGKLIALDGTEVAISVPKAPVTGAAASAQAAAEAKEAA